MEASKAREILLKVSSIWNRQNTDPAVQTEWTEALSRVSFESALETVRSIRDTGQTKPPTPGEIYLGARQRDDTQRLSRRALPAPKPTPLEVARNRKVLRDMIDQLGQRMALK